MKNQKFILWFNEIGKEDTALVGGKCANLGELERKVKVPVLPGFAVTTHAYKYFLKHAGIEEFIKKTLRGLNTKNIKDLQRRGKLIRQRICSAEVPQELRNEIIRAYKTVGKKIRVHNPYVAVRSSATAEDVETASFAGQQDTYLNVKGNKDLIDKIKHCFASLFTNRAISYRVDKGFDHSRVYLSVGIQKMGRSDTGAAGVMFTLDPDSGFSKVVVINGSYGLGEYVVQGKIIPDEFIVFKPTMGILEKKLGNKATKLVRGARGNVEKKVSREEFKRFCIKDEHILALTRYGMRIERHYKRPMDIEWVLDGETNRIYIVQARPETVHSQRGINVIEKHVLREKGKVLLTGKAIGRKIGCGKVNVIETAEHIHRFRPGEVLVTKMTDPDWEPIMKIASGIVTDKGGVTSHAAIVSRELGIPCVIGTRNSTQVLVRGQDVTVDCSSGEGRIYGGLLSFGVVSRSIENIPKTRTVIMINIGEPEEVFNLANLPIGGVGLAREEFIISSYVGEHPLSLLERGRGDKFVDALSMGVGKIAAAFYPRPVIVRLSDFKSDEYANLKGGRNFEPREDNPMIGWRGASRYNDPVFAKAFELECMALGKVRKEMGLKNVIIMIPFCRTPEEGRKVLERMEKFGLSRRRGCRFYVMAEIPSNVVLAEEFADIFDGFSIGSNDLTQLTLGLDRNSEKLIYLFDERNEAVKRMISMLIRKAHRKKRKVGICGQAPSNYADFTEFLVREGIDSISVSPDVVLDTILLVANVEKRKK